MKEYTNSEKIKYIEDTFKCNNCEQETLTHTGPTFDDTMYLCYNCGNIEPISFDEINIEKMDKYYKDKYPKKSNK